MQGILGYPRSLNPYELVYRVGCELIWLRSEAIAQAIKPIWTLSIRPDPGLNLSDASLLR